jgi:hypothetical protein
MIKAVDMYGTHTSFETQARHRKPQEVQNMYIDRRENKSKRPKVLLRESYREGNSIRKRLIADLSDLPPEHLEVLEASIQGDKLIKAEDVITKIKCTDTIPSGHIEAILTAIRRIGLPD